MCKVYLCACIVEYMEYVLSRCSLDLEHMCTRDACVRVANVAGNFFIKVIYEISTFYKFYKF